MTDLNATFARYLPLIRQDLRGALAEPQGWPPLYYRMLHYHMGWVDAQGGAAQASTGKHIRPVLTMLAGEGVSGSPNAARPAAAAVELIHNFSLLHDDIQDRSQTRRGRETAWTIWGEPQAINAGDALYTLAYLALVRLTPSEADPARTLAALKVLGETCLELTRGQHLDISFESRDEVAADEYLDMIAGKTAALLAGSARLGALTSEADETLQSHYEAFGHNLGMAFQILDDVLDIWGDPALTGKQAAIDIHQRKKSLPVLLGLARSEELRGLYAADAPFDDDAVEHVVSLLADTGARDEALELARRYSDDTVRSLEAADPQGEAGEALHALALRLLNRDH